VKLIDVEHEINQILDLLILALARQRCKALDQRLRELYRGAFLDVGAGPTQCGDKDPFEPLAEGGKSGFIELAARTKDGLWEARLA
jgi:hypothetical protein